MSKKQPTTHFYAVIPNGNGMDKQEAYMVDWGTWHPSRNIDWCRVPAPPDFEKGIRFGVRETLETAIQKAKAVSDGEYDVIVFRRKSHNSRSDDYWSFEPDRWIVDGRE